MFGVNNAFGYNKTFTAYSLVDNNNTTMGTGRITTAIDASKLNGTHAIKNMFKY